MPANPHDASPDRAMPFRPSTERARTAKELGTSTTPPRSGMPRIYFFSRAPEMEMAAQSLAAHIEDLRGVLDATK